MALTGRAPESENSVGVERIWRPRSMASFRAMVGTAQILGEVTIAAMTLDAGSFSKAPASTAAVNTGFVAFGLLQATAGLCLIRGMHVGHGLTIAVQLAQIPLIASNGLQYYLATLCGAVVSLRSGLLMDFQLHLGSEILLQWNLPAGWRLGVNLVPVLILVGLRRVYLKSAEARDAPAALP